MFDLRNRNQRTLDFGLKEANLGSMDNPIAKSARSAGPLLGKVLVSKRSTRSWDYKMGNETMDLKPGMILYVLSEKEGTKDNWGSRYPKTLKFLYNGIPGELSVGHSFDDDWGVIDPDERLGGKTFVFTGALSNTREYFKTLVECFGGTFGSSVTAKTSYLVVGDTTFQGDANHKSTKAKKAASLGVPVIGETGFYNLLRG